MHDAVTSLRERNRIETWNAVHEAASQIALADGPAAATIEAIASRAGISRRTFFNYFATKEDAILGCRAPQVTEEAVEHFRTSDDDELTRVVHLSLAVVRTCVPQETAARRREIVTAYPALRQRVHQLLTLVEKLIIDILRDRTEDIDGYVLDHPEPGHLEAMMMLAGVINKYAFSRYHESDEHDVTVFLPEAIALFRKVVDTTR